MKLMWVLLLSLFTFGCGYGSNYNGGMGGGGATPQISQLVPGSANAGDPGFVLTVNGSGFATNAVIYWNAMPLTTMYATNQQVTANIPAANIANPGMVPVYVRSSGRNSNTMNFTVN